MPAQSDPLDVLISIDSHAEKVAGTYMPAVVNNLGYLSSMDKFLARIEANTTALVAMGSQQGGGNNPNQGPNYWPVLMSIDRVLARIESNTRQVGPKPRQNNNPVGGGRAGNPLAILTAGISGGPFAALSVALGPAGAAVTAFTVAINKAYSAAKEFSAAASPDNLKFLGQSFDYLKGTIGTALLPAFVMLGAVALSLGNRFREILDKLNIPKFWRGVEKGVQSATENPASTWLNYATPPGLMYNAANGMIGAGVGAVQTTKNEGGNQAGLGALSAILNKASFGLLGENIQPVAKAGMMGPPKELAGDGKSDYEKNKDLIVKSITTSLGGSGYSSIADAQKKAQMASFKSPIEQMMLDLMMKAVKNLDIMADKPNAVAG